MNLGGCTMSLPMWRRWLARFSQAVRGPLSSARRRSLQGSPRPSVEQLEDRTMPAVDLLSIAAPPMSEPANAASTLNTGQGASMSESGRYVVFQSQATDVVAGQADSNGGWDIFLRDTAAHTTT